jgi:hypothetical protein
MDELPEEMKLSTLVKLNCGLVLAPIGLLFLSNSGFVTAVLLLMPLGMILVNGYLCFKAIRFQAYSLAGLYFLCSGGLLVGLLIIADGFGEMGHMGHH